MLLNAVVAGGVFAAYLTVLVLQLNPAVPLRPATVGALALPLVLLHGASFATLSYAVIVVRQLFGEKVLSPGWVSFRCSCGCALVAAGVAATLMWLNLRAPAASRSTATRRAAWRSGAVILTLGLALCSCSASSGTRSGAAGARVGGVRAGGAAVARRAAVAARLGA